MPNPTKSTHTPGPWAVQRDYVSAEHQVIKGYLIYNDVLCVARLSTVNPCAEANARLIAAAPEMLASIHDLLDVLSDVAPCTPGCGQGEPCVVHDARDLLARIEGESNG